MPTHTPSPHRFLAPAPPSTQKSKPKPQSSLRHGFTAHTPRPDLSSHRSHNEVIAEHRVTSAKRFVIAPTTRRTPTTSERDKGKQPGVDDEVWAHTQSTPRLRLPKLGKVDSISESSPSSSANANEAHSVPAVVPTVEPKATFSENDSEEREEDDDDDEEILFIPETRNKRRRVSPPQPSSSPTQAQATPLRPREAPQLVQTPAPPTHRFKVPPPPKPPSAPFDNTSTTAPTTTNPSRPHFILPRSSPSPSKSTTPLPETFSPSRKTGRYIPNGLASTMQSWILETADSGYAARSAGAGGVVWGRDKEDGVKMKVRVTGVSGGRPSSSFSRASEGSIKEVEAWPGGVVFVRGVTNASLYNASRASGPAFTQEDRGEEVAEIRVMLAGQGGARGKGKGGVRIREGGIVGVKAPIWDVEVDISGGDEGREKWIVGVEWVVLA